MLVLHWAQLHDSVQGFLPEAADQFAQGVVYPSFSPTVGFFLLLSTAYGIWKVGTSLAITVPHLPLQSMIVLELFASMLNLWICKGRVDWQMQTSVGELTRMFVGLQSRQ